MLLKMYNLLEIDPTLIQVIGVGRYSLVCFEKPLTIESIHLRSLLLLVCLCRLFDWAASPDALILYSVAEVPDSGLILDAKLSKHWRFSISALSLDSLVCFVMLCVIHSRIELEMIHHPSRAQLSWPFPWLSLVVSSFRNVFGGVFVLLSDLVSALRNPRPKNSNGFDLFFFSFLFSLHLFII